MVKRLFVILVLLSSLAKGQDVHFTQWMFSPLNLNPGNTGRFDGDFRVVGNFRSQWAAILEDQFTTFGLSYDQNFKVYNKTISAGLTFINDQSSVGKLTQNKLLLSTGINKSIKGHYISGGIQFGLLQKGIDYNAYTYPTQWDMDAGQFSNQGFSNNELLAQSNVYNFDLNLGLGWAKQIGSKFYPEVGYSIYHVNTPSESFLGSTNNLTMRHVASSTLNYRINEKYVIAPNILYMYQIKAQDLVFGALGKMKMEENKAKIDELFLGASFRDGFKRNYDAFNVIFGGKIQEWQLGISYDVNVSELSSITHYRGAFELSLIYISKSTDPTIYNVPCDLF